MYIVLYRWRVKPELEAQFVEAWSEVTRFYVENFDSLGSRLHCGDDGIWYAYAQWKTAEQREYAFQNAPKMPAGDKMRAAIEESFPEVKLEIQADYLK
jgi:hypothetical protein